MAKRSQKARKAKSQVDDFVVVTVATDAEQAREYQTLLKNNDIPATIREQDEQSLEGDGIAVMVPEEYIDEAHVVIESQDAYDDFYDFGMDDDEDSEDFDSDVFGDDF
jgi:dTDP-glucose pyrophosphorylase